MKKGFIALIPVFVAAALFSLGSIGLVASQRNKPLDSGSILSSSNSNGNDEDRSGSNNGEEEDDDEDKGNGSVNSQKSETKFEQKSEDSKSKSETKIEQKEGKLKIHTKNKVEGGQEDEFELEAEDEDDGDELEIEDEDEDEDEGTPSATSSVRPGRKIRSHFPITVNPVTGEKTVTTPSGIHTVILPDVAIQNMIKAGFPVVLPPAPSPDPSPPGEGTPSATLSASPSTGTDEGAVTLTEVDGQLVYEIPAVKPQKFLGVLKVDVKVKGIISAESGNILTIQKSLFDQILDLLSF